MKSDLQRMLNIYQMMLNDIQVVQLEILTELHRIHDLLKENKKSEE